MYFCSFVSRLLRCFSVSRACLMKTAKAFRTFPVLAKVSEHPRAGAQNYLGFFPAVSNMWCEAHSCETAK